MLQRELPNLGIVPIPIRQYLGLLERKEEPYPTIAVLLRDEMRDAYEERKRLCLGKLSQNPHLYLNPRFFSERIMKRIVSSKLPIDKSKLQPNATTFIDSPTDSKRLIVNIDKEKLNKKINVCRTIWAVLLGSGLEENKDFVVRTTCGGKRNYDIVLSSENISSVDHLLNYYKIS
ncbi:MAG: hypothetical protein ABSD68_00955 [Candidatus Micrarchaeales archaeon]|jgi:hypothetical protein